MARLTLTLTEGDLVSLLRGEPVQIFHEAPVREVVLEKGANLHHILETAEEELRKRA
jgi:precorrin-6B methylase 2